MGYAPGAGVGAGLPSIGGSSVHSTFATSDTSLLYEVDAKTGDPDFTLNFKGWPLFSSPSVAGNRLYVGSNEGKLFAVDLGAKKLAWTFQVDLSESIQGAPIVYDGVVYLTTSFNHLFAVDAKTGKELWHYMHVMDPAVSLC